MANDLFNSFMTGPDEKGRFGKFGGRFVSETLMPLILELEDQYEKAKLDLESKIPLKRMGSTSDISELVYFLASDEASYITGQTISVDGGLFMH